MESIQCINCLNKYNEVLSCCPSCKSDEFVRFRNSKYIYQGQVFTRAKWYSGISNFYEINNSINIRQLPFKLKPNYIKYIYRKNIKRYTFLGMILPMITFLILSIIFFYIGFFLMSKHEYSMFYNTSIFLFFLAVVFIFLVIGLLVQYYGFNYRCFYIKNRSYQYQYQKISKTTIYRKMSILDKYIS